MKKNIFIMFLMVSFHLEIFAQKQVQTDWEKNNLKGNVKTLINRSWKIDNGKIATDSIITETDFNEAGYINSKIINSSEQAKEVYFYDGKGNIIEYDLGINKSYYRYNSDSQLSEVDWPKAKYKYFYDVQKNLIELDYLDSTGAISDKEKYTNDIRGNRIEMAKFYNADDTSDVEYYQYDNNGKKILEEHYMMKFNYPEAKIPDLLWRYTFSYDSKGRKIGETEEMKNLETVIDSMFYDNMNNLIRNSSSQSEDENYLYKYDESGNWITKFSILGDVKADTPLITERATQSIVYFK